MTKSTSSAERRLARLAEHLGIRTHVGAGWKKLLATRLEVKYQTLHSWISRDRIPKSATYAAQKIGAPDEVWLKDIPMKQPPSVPGGPTPGGSDMEALAGLIQKLRALLNLCPDRVQLAEAYVDGLLAGAQRGEKPDNVSNF